jgi:hypothetical protein
MCARLEDGNLAGNNTWERSGGLGEDGPERWASSASDDGVVTGGRPAHERSWAGGQRDVGPTRRKRPETLF